MLSDDLPWPELGNVSRGATRGNQGQKGVLGPADNEGRCVLQLRVQPGVLAVRLNRQASDWYRILDNEVNRALKLTKSYWRKARRRQDYDARADQDHMELHEWLQQLKDKVMSHLELLMQKGEIQGPPYVMPDNVELSFLRKFIERQSAGIPHNPRLRRNFVPGQAPSSDPAQALLSTASMASAALNGSPWDTGDDGEEDSPTPSTIQLDTAQALLDEVASNRKILSSSRASLQRAQRETQEAFALYTSCLDAEARTRQQVASAEERRDALMSVLLERYRNVPMQDGTTDGQASAANGYGLADSRPGSSQSQENMAHTALPNNIAIPDPTTGWKTMRAMQWPQAETVLTPEMAHAQAFVSSERTFATRDSDTHTDPMASFDRKHTRSWDSMQAQADFEDVHGPPRKRMTLADANAFAIPRSMAPTAREIDRPIYPEWASQAPQL